jgi:cobalt-zinc-cadmium efflux system membrane fusion protein
MSAHLRSLFRFLAGAVPGLLALGCLVALGYWGHAHDWRFPKFAELWGEMTAPKEAKEEAGSAPEQGPNYDQPIRLASEETVKKLGLQVADVEERRMPEYVSAPGVVEYDHFHLAHLASPVPGTVWRILKRHGQRVYQGEALALINSADVGKARAELLQAQVQVQQRTRILRALNPALVQARQVEEAEMSLQEARLRRLSAVQALANLSLPVTLEGLDELKGEPLAERIRFLGLPEDLKEDLAREPIVANLLPLRSPFDGVVVDHDLALGEVVSTLHTQPLFTVADLSRMWISLSVRVEDVGRLKLGQTLTFRPDQTLPARSTALRKLGRRVPFSPLRNTLPHEGVKGQIEWISPEVDEKTRTVRLHAHVYNPGGQLLANGFGTGKVLVREKAGAITVPLDALQEDGPIQMVFLKIDETTFQPRKVKTGLRHGDHVEILTGVQPGDVVVTTGSHALKSELLKSRLGSED